MAVPFWEILNRSKSGPIVEEKQYDLALFKKQGERWTSFLPPLYLTYISLGNEIRGDFPQAGNIPDPRRNVPAI